MKNKVNKRITDRYKKIIKMYKTKNYSLNLIGRQVGLTRERVRQIVESHLVLTRQDRLTFVHAKVIQHRIDKYGSIKNYNKMVDGRTRTRLLKAAAKKNGKWHWRYDKCIECGTTERPHFSGGRCHACYGRKRYQDNPEVREAKKISTKKWTENNLEHFKAQQKIYLKEYLQRPEVKERMRKAQKKRYYDDIEASRKRSRDSYRRCKAKLKSLKK